jgi:hypothetical protein
VCDTSGQVRGPREHDGVVLIVDAHVCTVGENERAAGSDDRGDVELPRQDGGPFASTLGRRVEERSSST